MSEPRPPHKFRQRRTVVRWVKRNHYAHLELDAIDEHRYQKMCRGKMAWNKSEAKATRARMLSQGMERLDIYRRLYCNHWHLGHNPRKGNKPQE